MSELYGYSVENFIGQLPSVLHEDKRMYALSCAIANVIATHIRQLPLAKLYPNIDGLPEFVIDFIAEEFKTPFYEVSLPAEEKRVLVQETPSYYRINGTLGACKRILQAVFPGSSLEEWFDYGGEPYRFRVRAKNDERLREMTGFYEFLRLIDEIKRLAAKLEAVIVEADPIEAPLHIGVRGAIISRLTPTEQADNLSGRQTLRTGGRLTEILRAPPTEQPDNLSGRQTLRTGGQPQAVVRLPSAQQPDNLSARQTVRTGGQASAIASRTPTQQPDKLSATRIVRTNGRPAIVHVLRGREI